MSEENLPAVNQSKAPAVEKEYNYDAQQAIQKAGKIQDMLMDAVLDMDAGKLMQDTKLFEQVNSLLSNVNSTGTAVMRNNLVESNTNVGAVADAVIERMAERGVSLIKTVKDTGKVGTIPRDLEIEDIDFEPIQENMLVKGIQNTTYEEFAEQQGLSHE